jgi:hypothetical protein
VNNSKNRNPKERRRQTELAKEIKKKKNRKTEKRNAYLPVKNSKNRKPKERRRQTELAKEIEKKEPKNGKK